MTINRYLLTISCQQKKLFILKDNIDEVIDWLKQCIPSLHIVHYAYETSGKYHQLHWHAIVEVDCKVRWRPYCSYGDLNVMHKTYRIQWKAQYSNDAITYVYKDTHANPILQDQIIQTNYYRHNYAFSL